MKITDISVELIDNMGDDLTVVNAARVSFNKESDWEDIFSDDKILLGFKLSEKDQKLIHYLASHNHWTPFGHCQATFRIKAPIFVARQLMRHNVGLVVNEVSRRYVDSEPEFYWPTEWRKRAENKKQGSGEVLALANDIETFSKDAVEECVLWYTRLLEDGVAPEQARMILPQNMMTEWYWTGSLAAFARVCKLRTLDDAQAETRIVAEGISDYMRDKYPVSWGNLIGNIAV